MRILIPANPVKSAVIFTAESAAPNLDRAANSRILPAPRPPPHFGDAFPAINSHAAVKKDIHPAYHPVIFQDMSTGKQYVTRSTTKSDRVEKVDGVDHYVVSIGVTADSHPFFTGQKQFVDTEGRIDKFQKRFGAVRRAKRPGRGGEAKAEQ